MASGMANPSAAWGPVRVSKEMARSWFGVAALVTALSELQSLRTRALPLAD